MAKKRLVLPMARQPLTLEEDGSFAITYRAMYPVLKRFATRLVGDDDAEDVIQDAVLKYLIQQEKVQEVKPWHSAQIRLIVMVRDEALDLLRNTRGESRLMMYISGSTAAVRRWMSASRVIDAKDIMAAIHRALVDVKPSHREAWLMVREYGLKVSEAAELQKVKPETIRAAVSGANAELRRLLQPDRVKPTLKKGRKSE